MTCRPGRTSAGITRGGRGQELRHSGRSDRANRVGVGTRGGFQPPLAGENSRVRSPSDSPPHSSQYQRGPRTRTGCGGHGNPDRDQLVCGVVELRDALRAHAEHYSRVANRQLCAVAQMGDSGP